MICTAQGDALTILLPVAKINIQARRISTAGTCGSKESSNDNHSISEDYNFDFEGDHLQ
nr:hypothetical protein JVH1_4235 [Rhodococcus sp. JVH1]